MALAEGREAEQPLFHNYSQQENRETQHSVPGITSLKDVALGKGAKSHPRHADASVLPVPAEAQKHTSGSNRSALRPHTGDENGTRDVRSKGSAHAPT